MFPFLHTDTFKIAEDTGEITVAKPITDLNPPVYEFTLEVEARDHGDVALAGLTYVIVTIGDTNDRAPTFIHPARGDILYLPEVSVAFCTNITQHYNICTYYSFVSY